MGQNADYVHYETQARFAADALREALIAVEACGADVELTKIVGHLADDRVRLCRLFGLNAVQAYQAPGVGRRWSTEHWAYVVGAQRSSGVGSTGSSGAVEAERRQDQAEPCNSAPPTNSEVWQDGPCRYCGGTGIIGAESNPGRRYCPACNAAGGTPR